MPRYFLELAYKGTAYAGFQVQQNANTVQAELQKALAVFFRSQFELTGSSRTDAGVHAAQNYFHFDSELLLTADAAAKACYRLNAILPGDIVAKKMVRVADTAHCRFDALSRSYIYSVYQAKDPFRADRAWFYPYPLELSALQACAQVLRGTHDFTAFAKKNAQVKTHMCTIIRNEWLQTEVGFEYLVTGNRFLRGMVRALVATMLREVRAGGGAAAFAEILSRGDASAADFSAPPHGLLLEKVTYPENFLRGSIG